MHMTARFSELNKVRVISDPFGQYEGYVIGSLFRDGRWVYKISLTDDQSPEGTFDNWMPEEWLEKTR